MGTVVKFSAILLLFKIVSEKLSHWDVLLWFIHFHWCLVLRCVSLPQQRHTAAAEHLLILVTFLLCWTVLLETFFTIHLPKFLQGLFLGVESRSCKVYTCSNLLANAKLFPRLVTQHTLLPKVYVSVPHFHKVLHILPHASYCLIYFLQSGGLKWNIVLVFFGSLNVVLICISSITNEVSIFSEGFPLLWKACSYCFAHFCPRFSFLCIIT